MQAPGVRQVAGGFRTRICTGSSRVFGSVLATALPKASVGTMFAADAAPIQQPSHSMAGTPLPQPSPQPSTFPSPSELVPSTLPECLRVFLFHPSVVAAICIIAGAGSYRLTLGIGLWDIPVAALAVVAWVMQEWAIHKYLLHSPFDWLGKAIHQTHHEQPYHHVSIDGPEIVVPFMVLTGGLFWVLLNPLLGSGLVLTWCCGYWLAGLLSYTLVHYLVHTRWIPKSQYMRTVRQNHMLHHLRNHDNWFAFSVPEMDQWMGTCPPHPGAVPLKTVVARQPPPSHR